MPAKREEIVIQSNPVYAQQFLKPCAESGLHISCIFRGERCWRDRTHGSTVPLRTNERLHVPLCHDQRRRNVRHQNALKYLDTVPRRDTCCFHIRIRDGHRHRRMSRQLFIGRRRRVRDAAHGKSVDLGQHFIVFVHQSDIERREIAMRAVFLPRADMAEEMSRKRAIAAQPLVGDRQIKIIKGLVALDQIQRASRRQVQHRWMKLERPAFGGEPRIELDFGQAFSIADMQALQTLPPRSKVEELLLLRPMPAIESHLAGRTTRRNRAVIDLARRQLTWPPDAPRRVFRPLRIFVCPACLSKNRKLEVRALCLIAVQLDSKLLCLSIPDRQRCKKEHVPQLNRSAHANRSKGTRRYLHIARARYERRAGLEAMLGEEPLFADAELSSKHDVARSLLEPSLQKWMNGSTARCHSGFAPRSEERRVG